VNAAIALLGASLAVVSTPVGTQTRIGGLSLGGEARCGDLRAASQRRLWAIWREAGEVASDSAQYHDDETDLNQNHNRFYDASHGVYWEPEPLYTRGPEYVGAAAEQSLVMPAYGYAGENPVNFVDADGDWYSEAIDDARDQGGGSSLSSPITSLPPASMDTACLSRCVDKYSLNDPAWLIPPMFAWPKSLAPPWRSWGGQYTPLTTLPSVIASSLGGRVAGLGWLRDLGRMGSAGGAAALTTTFVGFYDWGTIGRCAAVCEKPNPNQCANH
jgi:RHS repeat-associated protein